MEEKLNKSLVKKFVLFTKVLPILLATVQLANTIISFFYGNDIFLNYIGSISLLPIIYLYVASYTFKLCEYYRMFLHYSVAINLLNIYDYYIGINLTDVNYFILIVLMTIITLFIIIYLKFFK